MPDTFDDYLRPLGGAYTIVRELGGGGMSRVFLAREDALGRAVVIKVLSPTLAQSLSAERFTREIQLAAALQEPHIVPLLAAGQTMGGLPFYAMPFVDGQSLRARLLDGSIPVPTAVNVLRDVSNALAYAHRKGVVHRDIKPENILLSSGTAVVTDFGIAKALAASKAEAPGGTLTSVGTSLGTPAYMAPEQATGDEVDGRADLYSWGVIAYEMLSGAHPFAGKTSIQKMIAAQVLETPLTPNWAAHGVSSSLGTLVMQCLQKDPESRPRSADDVLAALDAFGTRSGGGATSLGKGVKQSVRRRWATGTAILIVAAISVAALARGPWSVSRRNASTSAAPGAKRIAVLPFDNVDDTALMALTDGISSDVRAKLIALPALHVIANGSSDQYRDTKKSFDQIASELGVSYLLVGRVRSEPHSGTSPRVRIAAELIHVVDGRKPVSSWHASYVGDSINLFDVETQIATAAAAQLALTLAPRDEAMLARRSTSSVQAWETMHRAQAIEDEGAVLTVQQRAAAEYQKAIRLDPNFAEAWAYLSEIYVSSALFGVPTAALSDSALVAARRSVELAPDREFGYEALANYHSHFGSRYAQALEDMNMALAAAPRTARILTGVADLELKLGRLQQGTSHLEEAAKVDPRSAQIAEALAWLYENQRRFSEAIRSADRALAFDPTNPSRIRVRAEMSLAQGDTESAAEVVYAAAAGTDSTMLAMDLARHLDDQLIFPAQLRLLARLRPAAYGGDRAGWAFVCARTYATMGNPVRTRAYADTAVSAYDVELQHDRVDGLRADRALMLTYIGRMTEAVAEADRLRTPRITGQYSLIPTFMNRIPRIYVRAHAPDKALEVLEMISQPPLPLTPAWIAIDPDFIPLRGNPRYERLIHTAQRPR